MYLIEIQTIDGHVKKIFSKQGPYFKSLYNNRIDYSTLNQILHDCKHIDVFNMKNERLTIERDHPLTFERYFDYMVNANGDILSNESLEEWIIIYNDAEEMTFQELAKTFKFLFPHPINYTDILYEKLYQHLVNSRYEIPEEELFFSIPMQKQIYACEKLETLEDLVKMIQDKMEYICSECVKLWADEWKERLFPEPDERKERLFPEPDEWKERLFPEPDENELE